MSIPVEIGAVIIGFFLGFVAFIGEDVIRRWQDGKDIRKKVLKHLIAEAKENRSILDVSTFVSLLLVL
ncbi:MAG: hypothetical protein ABSF44_16410 [Candidatus Bathyarchaeia archaeon]|jgi:hypothetical protein